MKWVFVEFVCGVVEALTRVKVFVGIVDMVEELYCSNGDEWQ